MKPKTTKYLLVANSFLLPSSIMRDMAHDAIIVALDAAATKLANIGIKPNIIIGDFDSLTADPTIPNIWGIRATTALQYQPSQTKLFSTPYLGNFAVMVVPALNQNFTDLQKALYFIKHHVHNYYDYPRPSIINIAATAGPRLDHELANIFTLQQVYDPKLAIYLHEEYQSLEYVMNKTVSIKGIAGDYCGLFGMPSAYMTVLNGGLAYGSRIPYKLAASQCSAANRLTLATATVKITGQALIAHPPQFPAQRQFFHKSRHAQLQELLDDNNRQLYMDTAANCYHALQTVKQDIFCVSHPLASLSTLNKASQVLLSIPTPQYQLFLSMLPP